VATLRLLIADDEPLVRLGLRQALEPLADVEIVAECGTVEDTLEGIQAHRPDVVMLDVQMPGGTGLEVLRRLGPDGMPAVVFVTAFDTYAVQAFDVHAVDYVLKPFDPERVRRAVERARARLAERDGAGQADRLRALLDAHDERAARPDRLVVRAAGRFDLVPVESVDWVEAADNYVELHCGPRRHLMQETLRGLARRLDPRQFVRIHRSRLVNRSRIVAIHVLAGATYEIELRDGTRLTSGRQYRDVIQKLLQP
jgi:two-component system LytT family response regulator